jgi:lipid-binding SYLF domain-containing protein
MVKNMVKHARRIGVTLICATAILMLPHPRAVGVASATNLDADAAAALQALYDKTPAAQTLGKGAKGILVFPNIVKAGFLVGAQYGDGTLFRGGQKVANYNVVAASYGLQAGVQAFGYALFLMTDAAVAYLDKSDGWELGVGPSIVVVDEGFAKAHTTTTLQSDVYAFIFDQKGLMAGLGLQGSKITRINR